MSDFAHNSVREFDGSARFLRQLGTPGQYSDLSSVAVNQSSGEIYVGDYCMYWFTPDGTPDGKACPPQGEQESLWLTSLAAGPGGEVFGARMGPDREEIDVFSSAHQFVSSWPVRSYPSGETVGLSTPMASDAQGNVYFTDGSALEVDSPAGVPLGSWALPVDPNTIAVSGSRLYAASGSGTDGEITAYDLPLGAEQSGTSLQIVGSPISVPNLGWTGWSPGGPTFAVSDAEISAVTSDHHVVNYGLDGTLLGSWGSLANDDFVPSWAVGDKTGDVYVVDVTSSYARVVKYDASRDPPAQIADLSSYYTQGFGPTGAAINSDGNLVVNSFGTLITLDQSGNVLGTVGLQCDFCIGQFAYAPSGDIYVRDYNDIDKFSPAGSLISTWPVAADSLATDSAGNVYLLTDDGEGISKYSPEGKKLLSWNPGDDFEPSAPRAITTDAQDRVYLLSDDGVHIYDSSGHFLAAWPVPIANTGAISVAANGDVVVSGGELYRLAPAGYEVVVFHNLLNPLPPPPSPDVSPWAAGLGLTVSASTQPSNAQLETMLGCSPPSRTRGIPRKATCAGELSLTLISPAAAADRLASSQSPRFRGQVRFSVPVNRSGQVRVRLNGRIMRLLKRAGRLRGTVTAVFRTGPRWTTVTRRIVLHAPTRRHRHHHARRGI